ncbi:hypothetical protein ACFL6S_36045 [Candidatus Poribacteria bacterium]
MLGINLGFVWHGTDFDFLRSFSPTYSINLQGKSYSLSSGYSIRVNRGIINSRLYENLNLFLPDLPTVRVIYSRQGTRDTGEERRVDTTGRNIQFGVEDSIGPFRISLNRREHTTRDEIRGPEHDTESSNTSGDVNFTRSFGRLLSINGRYGLEQLDTERASTGKTKGETENYSMGFRLSPIPTIALSGSRTGRLEDRETELVNASPLDEDSSVTKNDYLTNRFQLMLQPIVGIRLGAVYSNSDTTRETGESESDENEFESDESRSLTVDLQPRRELSLSARFTTRDSQEDGEKASIVRQRSFNIRVEPLEKLRISMLLNQSELNDYIELLYNDRDVVTTSFEAMLTENLRTNFSYNWQRSIKILEGETSRDTQNQLSLVTNYSFIRMLNLNFRASRNIIRDRGDSNNLSGMLSYTEYGFRSSIRYSRSSSAVTSLAQDGQTQEGRRTTQTFSITLDQQIGQKTNLYLSYESRSGGTALGKSGSRRISFRVDSRF